MHYSYIILSNVFFFFFHYFPHFLLLSFFFFNDTATTEIYTLSLHDALPISSPLPVSWDWPRWIRTTNSSSNVCGDRKSTRLNSSHVEISYAVFCLKKKKKKKIINTFFNLIKIRPQHKCLNNSTTIK